MTEPLLVMDRVSKLYTTSRGIRDIDLTINRGDIYGLFGPNGAGKTTLLKLATGLCTADRGSITLFGSSLSGRFETAMARVGCIIETADAYPYMSGYRNLKLASRFYPGVTEGHIREILHKVGLQKVADEKVSGYSMGMKQRLAIAGALLPNPELVILDEPTTGLDIEGILDIRHLITGLAQEQGVTFLISSHMISEMELVCSRFGILADGMLIREGTSEEIGRGRESLEQFYLTSVQQWKGETRICPAS